MSKVWFITGTSRGLGREWALAALERGDRVAATARDLSSVQHLVDIHGDQVLPLAVDVTDGDAVTVAVAAAVNQFGRLDIVVNNAGYGLFGRVEEITDDQAHAQLETNLFGALRVSRAALPVMRERRQGHIIQVSSVGGLLAGPGLGLYHASKWALEAVSESLAAEVAPFGIHVTLVEPGAYRTDWFGASAVRVPSSQAYDDIDAPVAPSVPEAYQTDPSSSRAEILAIADAENPPLRVLLGAGLFEAVSGVYQQRLRGWDNWRSTVDSATLKP